MCSWVDPFRKRTRNLKRAMKPPPAVDECWTA